MGLLNRLGFGPRAPVPRHEPGFGSVRADGGSYAMFDLENPDLDNFLRGGPHTHSGAHINDKTALTVAVAWRCASIICGVVSTLPCDLMLRENETSRSAAVKHPFREVLTVKPNNRQTPSEFKTMMMLHKLQRGDGFAMKIASRGKLIALWPLDPNRMVIIENDDLSLTYRYTRRNGTTVDFAQGEIFHLRGLSWDGVRGLPVIRYMAEALGMNLQTQKAAAKLFANGQFRPGWIKGGAAPLSDQAYTRLKESLAEVSGVDSEEAGRIGILEEGYEFQSASMSAVDAQLIELMGFSRTDVGMFYGVPPHLYGDTDKQSSWGTGVEQQNLGFLQYTIQPHLTGFSDAAKRDCLSMPGDDARLYVHFDLKGFLRADAAGRAAYFSRALGGGGNRPWMTQNQVCAAEDLPKRSEPWADVLPEIGNVRVTETGTLPNDDPNPSQV